MRLNLFAAAVLACLALPAPAVAWGNEGHETIALIARSYLTSDVRAKVNAILAADTDTLTAPNMASRATWADAWRSAGHRETASWHFVDIELAAPDLMTTSSISLNRLSSTCCYLKILTANNSGRSLPRQPISVVYGTANAVTSSCAQP